VSAIATEIKLDESALSKLKESFRGQLVRPRDPDYGECRQIWNGSIDRSPALIARCAGVADVIAAVRFARESGLVVAVRSGGHSFPGQSVCDGGVVIDLGLMKGIRVDPVQRTARAQAGVLLGELDRETQAFGLAVPAGIVTHTGLSGLTLGGGIGWLMRKYGLTIDQLLAVDLITADGDFVRASETENPDLFWGVRGGGGNFGVVTSLEFRLHPVGPILGGMVLHLRQHAPEVIRFYREFTQQAPEELTTYCMMLTTPDGVPVVALVACYNGPLEQGEAVLRPLRSFGSPVADLIHPMPYREMQSMFDAGFPHGLRNYWKGNFLRELPDAAIDRLVAHAEGMPSPLSAVALEFYGGAASRVGEGETAFPHRQALYDLVIIAQWADAAEDEPNIQWAREITEAMEPYASGRVYVNLLGVEGEERVKAAYGANYDRLVALKNKYDPANLFRLNQNIKPTA
jgi:FAD/FMN-containing dehydrogenase